MEAPTKKPDCFSVRLASFITFIAITLELGFLSNPAHTVWAIAIALLPSFITIPFFERAPRNASSVGSAEAGTAESSAPTDRTAQTVEHFPRPTFIWVAASLSVRADRL